MQRFSLIQDKQIVFTGNVNECSEYIYNETGGKLDTIYANLYRKIGTGKGVQGYIVMPEGQMSDAVAKPYEKKFRYDEGSVRPMKAWYL